MNAHVSYTRDPAIAAVARRRKSLDLLCEVYDKGDVEANRLASEECNQSHAALGRIEPVTLDGVISYLRYVIEEDGEGTDLTSLVHMLRSAERGLCKMRGATS